jgi:hypothetical protein
MLADASIHCGQRHTAKMDCGMHNDGFHPSSYWRRSVSIATNAIRLKWIAPYAKTTDFLPVAVELTPFSDYSSVPGYILCQAWLAQVDNYARP